MAEDNDSATEPLTRRVVPGQPTLQQRLQAEWDALTPKQRADRIREQEEAKRLREAKAERERLAERDQHKETIQALADTFHVDPEKISIRGPRIVVDMNENEVQGRYVETRLKEEFKDQEIDISAGRSGSRLMLKIAELEADNSQFLKQLEEKAPGILAEDMNARYKPGLQKLQEAGFPTAGIVYETVSIPYPSNVSAEQRGDYVAQLNAAGLPVAESRSGAMTMRRDALLSLDDKELATIATLKDGVVAEPTAPKPERHTEADPKTLDALAAATGLKVVIDDPAKYILDAPAGLDQQGEQALLDRLNKAAVAAGLPENTFNFTRSIKGDFEVQKDAIDNHPELIKKLQTELNPKADIFAGRSDEERDRMAAESAQLDAQRAQADFNRERERIGIKPAPVPGAPTPVSPAEPAQQEAGAAFSVVPAPRPPEPERDTVDEIKQAQTYLEELGENINPRGTFKNGGKDGIKGAVTEALIKEKQKEFGLPETGDLDKETMAQLKTAADKAQGRVQQQGADTALPPVQPLEEPVKAGTQPAAEPVQVADAEQPRRKHEQPEPISPEFRDPPGIPKKEEDKPFVPLHLLDPKEKKPFLDPDREHRLMKGEAQPPQENVAAWLESMKARYDSHAQANSGSELSHRQAEDRTMEQYLKDAKSIGEGMTTKPVGAALDMAANDDVPALAAGGKLRATAAGISA